MKIASRRTLEHMEIAAELRVHGATWDTIAQYLGRHKRVLTRWVRYYAADWERLFREAERRDARRAANELARPT
ncbi:MAG: hypothetical protein ACJ8F7_09130 [Gemmataceae bacterium]